jgi:hypothetical protein
MAGWADFFVAEVGASAALAGFVIVAISINLARIISYPWLPGRAAETLVAPTGVLVVSSYMLVPGQQLAALVTELFVTGGVMWLMPTIIQIRTWRAEAAVPRRSLVVRCTLSLFSSVPILIAAALMLMGDPNAIVGMVPGIIVSLVATVINAWVLLVEIVR